MAQVVTSGKAELTIHLADHERTLIGQGINQSA